MCFVATSICHKRQRCQLTPVVLPGSSLNPVTWESRWENGWQSRNCQRKSTQWWTLIDEEQLLSEFQAALSI